jgi:16S rRNA (cytosine967-C5)-methyltransferase
MSDSFLLARATQIIDQVTADQPADYVLRGELGADKELLPAEKRDITKAVFTYFRWLSWLDNSASTASRLSAAINLQRKFDADPTSIKPEALAARAVPEWVKSEIDLTPAYLRHLQSEPALWIRVQQEFAAALPRSLGNLTPSPSPLVPEPHRGTTLRYTGNTDLFRTSEFHQGVFEIQDIASQQIGRASCRERV